MKKNFGEHHNHIILIGNGFDLAHKLETSYGHFINHIIESNIDGKNAHSNLIRIPINIKTIDQFRNRKETNFSYVDFPNKLFRFIFKRYQEANWCNIEKLYFDYISNQSHEAVISNKEFSEIRIALEEYLHNEISKPFKLKFYDQIFKYSRKNKKKIIFVNFNYTRTINQYLEEADILIDIHGETKNGDNPLIFGYAASDIENSLLLDKNEDAYLDYIKKYLYKDSTKYDDLLEYLNGETSYDVSILGHSLAESDRLILEDILVNSNCNTIRIFYYKEHQDYSSKVKQIDRMFRDSKTFDKIINFKSSVRMPQVDDGDEMMEEIHSKLKF